MTKTIKVHYNNDEVETVNTVENLWELEWSSYSRLERQIEANISVSTDGEIESLNIDPERMGDWFVNFQETLAEIILEQENIQLDNVKTKTIKEIVKTYSSDLDKLGLKLKKNQQE